MCLPPCVYQRACICAACLLWCGGGGEGLIIDWEKRLREQDEERRMRKRTGCSWAVLRIQSPLSSSLHTSQGNRNTESLILITAHFLSCCLDFSCLCSFTFCLIVYSELSGRFKHSFVPSLSGPFVFVKPCQNAATLYCFL